MRTTVVTDLDGTLFHPSFLILTAPFFNLQTKQILKKQNIPFIIATGRKDWNTLDSLQLFLLGLPQPTAVICGAGTKIYIKNNRDQLILEPNWLKNIPRIPSLEKDVSFPFASIHQDNQHLTRIKVDNMLVIDLFHNISSLKKKLGNTIDVLFTEKLLCKNTKDIFSGDILITPKAAGKANALKYIFSILNTKYNPPAGGLDTIVFGDASIDIPMLSMSHKNIATYPFLVSPTPLAQLEAKKHKQITIVYGNGPKIILEKLRKYVIPAKAGIQEDGSRVKPGMTRLMMPRDDSVFSPAQNNPARTFIKLLEPLLDKILDKKLSANDISLLGLTYIKKSLPLISSDDFFKKTSGWYYYAFGTLTDVLDGIRARERKGEALSVKGKERKLYPKRYTLNADTIPGQLVDGFCDRAKEFYQLYSRDSFLAAASCILPSIARAQAEMYGIIVKEKDEKGGSMIDRTKLLFLSLLYLSLGNTKKSLAIDQEIYTRNVATFENRLSQISHACQKILHSVQDDKTNSLQRTALERFFLYVQLLQEEYEILRKNNGQQWSNETMKPYTSYLSLNIPKLRKQYGFAQYSLLSLKNADILKNVEKK